MNFGDFQDEIKTPARIEHVRVENYRALRRVEFPMGPLTLLLGPNGSGKSTLFDVFSFLSDCFRHGLRYAWDKRGRAREIRTRGSAGPIIIEIKYREQPALPLITYHLAIDEEERGPVVVEEWLQWRRGQRGKPFRFLEYRRGEGRVISGEMPDEKDQRVEVPLRSPDLIAVNTLGQIAEHPRVAALREFIMGWYLSYLSLADTRGQPEAGPQERLSRTGDNLPNVIQFLKEQHPDRLQKIETIMRQRVPRLASVVTEIMPDGRLLLQIKDAPFDQPILARFASDGTLKMLAYLTILYGPNPPPFIGIEEPENFLYPHLLPGLAEECRAAAEFAQILISTHSPTFVNWFAPEEVLVLSRDRQGYTRIALAADIRGVQEFLDAGARLGDLWLEGYLTSP